MSTFLEFTFKFYIDGEGVYFNDYFNWKNIPQFTKLVFESPAAHIASQLMESRYRYVKGYHNSQSLMFYTI